jgi:hypothetical protein
VRWLRRAKKPNVLTDYRRVSEAVHVKRAEREGNLEASREATSEVERAVRSYQPDQQLAVVRKRIRGFEEHSRETPRTFGEDWIPPARRPIEPETVEEARAAAKVFLAVNLPFGALLLTSRFLWGRFPGDLVFVWCGVIACALQISVSLLCWERKRWLCVAGVSVGLIVFTFGCDFLVRHLIR